MACRQEGAEPHERDSSAAGGRIALRTTKAATRAASSERGSAGNATSKDANSCGQHADRDGRHCHSMTIPFEQVEEDFRRLRDFVLDDLDRITGQAVGGNYAAAALIVCAYDAIASLRDGRSNRGELPFGETLPPDWRPVAPSLYDALRNGIVHGIETKTIRVAGRDLELAVSWREGRHLTLDHHGRLVLAVLHLADDLRAAFDAFEVRLRHEPDLRDRFRRRLRHDRIHEVRSPAEQEAWQRLLDGS